MGRLERWDRKNQATLEEDNRRYKAGLEGATPPLGGIIAASFGAVLIPDSWPLWVVLLGGVLMTGAIYLGRWAWRRRKS